MKTKWKPGYAPEKKRSMLSMTIPDQTMSIREILARYARGLPYTAGKVPIYNGEDAPNLEEIGRLDLSEKHDILQSNAEHMEELRQKFSQPELFNEGDKVNEKEKTNEKPSDPPGPAEAEA